MRILVVEDDIRIAKNVSKLLEEEGYVIDVCYMGDSALLKVDTEDYDVIILDRMLPDTVGVDIARHIRKEKIITPILFLTAMTQLEDKIEGFESGADDYLTKPFMGEELIVRVKALIRRNSVNIRNPEITIFDLTINTNSHRVVRSDNLIDLSPREYSLLEYLAFNKGKAQSRLDILSHVWGEEIDLFSNTVDVHIR